jgi:hypothetical protein
MFGEAISLNIDLNELHYPPPRFAVPFDISLGSLKRGMPPPIPIPS